MKALNGKVMVTSPRWELRAKLTDETRDAYVQIKKQYESKAGRQLSEGAFLSVFLDDYLKTNLQGV